MLTDTAKNALPTNVQKLNDEISCRLKQLFADTIFIYLNSDVPSLAMFTVPT